MPRRSEPSVAAGYNEWIERVIGNNRRADPDHRTSGGYGFFEYKAKRLGLTVKAKVYPDMGSRSVDEPHLWGVVFPEQARKVEYDEHRNTTKVVREYAAEKRFGAKAATQAIAMQQAEECIQRGGWDAIEREPNGTLTALKTSTSQAEAFDDIPEGY